MSNPVGFNSFCGIGLENGIAVPVKSQVELDLTQDGLRSDGRPTRVPTINRKPVTTKIVSGRYRESGSLQCDVTPDKCTKLIYAALSSLATSGSNPYTNIFKRSGSGVLKPFTAQVLKPQTGGDWFHLFPGLMIDQLQFAQSNDGILQMTAQVLGRGKETFLAAEQSDVGIAASALEPFNFDDCTCSVLASGTGTGTLGISNHVVTGVGTAFVADLVPGDQIVVSGATYTVSYITSATVMTIEETATVAPGASYSVRNRINADVTDFNLSILTGLQMVDTLNGDRAPRLAYGGDGMVQGSCNLVFDDITIHRMWMGAATNVSPIQVSNLIQTAIIQFDWGAGQTASFQIKLPKGFFATSEAPVQNRNGTVNQKADFESLWDASSSSDVIATMISAEQGSTITGLGTNI